MICYGSMASEPGCGQREYEASSHLRRDWAGWRLSGGVLALLESGQEPALALRRRTVRERVWRDKALHLLLQPVVAIAEAVCSAESTSPGSRKLCLAHACAHTPARQSACSSTRTCSALASALLADACWCRSPAAGCRVRSGRDGRPRGRTAPRPSIISSTCTATSIRHETASAIGDDRLQKEMQGFVAPDSFTHGESAQRKRWFLAGFQQGKVLRRIGAILPSHAVEDPLIFSL